MIHKRYIIILFLFNLCCTSMDNTDLSNNAPINIRFSSRIQALPSKSIITETSFPDNSEIGIYAWGHHQKDGDTNTTLRDDLNNAKYTKETGSEELIPSIDAHYPINPDTLLNFYAYYPYTTSINSPQKISFNLNEQEDIMWATPVLNRGKVSTESNINLQFNHILSAITLKFKKANDIKEDMTLQSISLENYAPTAELNIQTGQLTQTALASPFPLIEGLTTTISSEETTILTDCLLCPIEKPVFIIHLSGKDYRIESSKAFETGKKQTFEFTIQAKDISISGQIRPWLDGGSSNETVFF
ncbi:fimbrillin family protein [Parabacteroides sp. AM08-6]|nr:fimbrillin family protein [Parabacteroides sp. AM08-6]